ncbi:putative d-amino-acid oxidase [Diplodia seriata]|uniref:Putative d-amino-acid oxidase n=1 Tax=Diplodia seriata TaxID=420778 RepID=A0A0G2H3H7_9PEZI|nr:putative d-amino-acid oxidase [Diplodia seriata]
MSSQLKGMHIVVIGAGVIGLQTAITLLEAGAAVTIIAKHVPGDKAKDYTSPWYSYTVSFELRSRLHLRGESTADMSRAGAQWRTHATAEDKEIQEWDIESYNIWLDMVEKEKSQASFATKSGVEKFHSIFYWTGPDTEIPSGPHSAWWAPHMRNFRELPTSELPPGAHAGATYDAVTIDTGVYLPYLLSRARSLGATLIEAALPMITTTTTTDSAVSGSNLPHALATATRLLAAYHHSPTSPPPTISAFVNATGIAARSLVPDPSVFPIRGQTVLVRGLPRALTTVWRPDGTLSYVIPRATSGTAVLGGTKEAGDWRAEEDAATTRGILERCKALAPELLTAKEGGFELLAVNVGFRPGRIGGPRVEVEEWILSLRIFSKVKKSRTIPWSKMTPLQK